MSDYISREEAIETVCYNCSEANICGGSCDDTDRLRSIPAADVREVPRGRWQITDAWPHNVYCSECHKRFAQTHWAVWEDGSLPRAFCPNCGALMEDKEAGE